MNKFTLLTAGVLASAMVTGTAFAEEVATTSEATTVESTTVATTVEATTVETTTQPTTQETSTTTEVSKEPTTSTEEATTSTSNPVSVRKEGTEIVVQNPTVTLDRSEGEGKYSKFKVKTEVKVPDEIPVNKGDKVVLNLPEEVQFQTSFSFDVHNSSNDVVGTASADASTGKLTTIFNDYFQNHPLNKQMAWEFDAKWSDRVEQGKPVSVNFNGTVVTADIKKDQEIGKDELVAKWGSQDKDDPTIINWTVRVNYARRVLNTVKLLDTMSDNQKLVDDYLEVKYIDSVEPWIEAGDAKELVKSMVKNPNGFELTLARLERMVYVNYKTKLTSAVKDSVNPTNSVKLVAGDTTESSSIGVSLVGGRGDAVGENKPAPTWELPNEAPIVEIPELSINDVPLLPPAPVVEIPELPLEDIPLLPPAPILEKPYLPIEDIPMMPPAPILELPELKITEEPSKAEEPKKFEEPKTPSKPQEPKKEEKPELPSKPQEPKKVEVPIQKDSKVVKEVSTPEPKGTYSAPAMLPNTGEEYSLAMAFTGVVLMGAAFVLKKKEN